jgi:hypothetical protein
MIENARILTGSPDSVEKKVNEYLASHPNATVLSSSVTTSQELEPIDSDKAKEKAKPAKAKTVTTVCVVVGIKL